MSYNVFFRTHNKTTGKVHVSVIDKKYAEGFKNMVDTYPAFNDYEAEIFDTSDGLNLPVEWLPNSVVEKMKRILKYYRKVHVEFYDDEWEVCTGYCLLAYHPRDFCVAGDYNVDQFYTPEEQEKNYKEAFG